MGAVPVQWKLTLCDCGSAASRSRSPETVSFEWLCVRATGSAMLLAPRDPKYPTRQYIWIDRASRVEGNVKALWYKRQVQWHRRPPIVCSRAVVYLPRVFKAST